MEQKKVRAKLYISLPITGQSPRLVTERCKAMKEKYTSLGYEVVTPRDIITDPDTPYNVCMGKCLEVLLTCDAIKMLDGWRESHGCCVERFAAMEYGLKFV